MHFAGCSIPAVLTLACLLRIGACAEPVLQSSNLYWSPDSAAYALQPANPADSVLVAYITPDYGKWPTSLRDGQVGPAWAELWGGDSVLIRPPEQCVSQHSWFTGPSDVRVTARAAVNHLGIYLLVTVVDDCWATPAFPGDTLVLFLDSHSATPGTKSVVLSTGTRQVVVDGILIDSLEAVVRHLEDVDFPATRQAIAAFSHGGRVDAAIREQARIQKLLGPDILRSGWRLFQSRPGGVLGNARARQLTSTTRRQGPGRTGAAAMCVRPAKPPRGAASRRAPCR